MLEIRRLRRYRIAKYPRVNYQPRRQHPAVAITRQGLLSALLLALIDSCNGSGVTGPPPVVPDLVTENEAREIIEQVFSGNSIQLTPDFNLRIVRAEGDTLDLTLDGYSDSLRVGYEYVAQSDYDIFTSAATHSLDSLTAGSGPYIEPIQEALKYDDYVQQLEATVQEFIDSLKASGAI